MGIDKERIEIKTETTIEVALTPVEVEVAIQEWVLRNSQDEIKISDYFYLSFRYDQVEETQDGCYVTFKRQTT